MAREESLTADASLLAFLHDIADVQQFRRSRRPGAELAFELKHQFADRAAVVVGELEKFFR